MGVTIDLKKAQHERRSSEQKAIEDVVNADKAVKDEEIRKRNELKEKEKKADQMFKQLLKETENENSNSKKKK